MGSLGNGRASLSIEGQPVPVLPNGSFLAYLPVPRSGAPGYRLVAALGADTVRWIHPVGDRPLEQDAPSDRRYAVTAANLRSWTGLIVR
jgi:N-acetylmuramoyl-L-alanine amidase